MHLLISELDVRNASFLITARTLSSPTLPPLLPLSTGRHQDLFHDLARNTDHSPGPPSAPFLSFFDHVNLPTPVVLVLLLHLLLLLPPYLHLKNQHEQMQK